MLDQAPSVAVPSIVVHNGSNSAPGSPTMERNLRAQRTLSKQVDIKQVLKVAYSVKSVSWIWRFPT